jgi:hypothetical protein
MPTRQSQYANRSIRVSHRVFVEDSQSPGLYERIDKADRNASIEQIDLYVSVFDGQGSSPMDLASRTPWWDASSHWIVTTIDATTTAPGLSWRLPMSGRLLRAAKRASGSGFAELPVESA